MNDPISKEAAGFLITPDSFHLFKSLMSLINFCKSVSLILPLLIFSKDAPI